MGRGKRREAIAELLRAGVARLEQFSSPWLLQVTPGSVEENSEGLVFVTERVLGTLATIIASQHGTREMGAYKKATKAISGSSILCILLKVPEVGTIVWNTIVVIP